MPSRLYETLFLLDSTRVSADPEAARTTVHGVLERYGAEILVSRPWDENRKLVYPIKKQKKGYYHAVYYKMDSLKQVEVERDFAISELVLRLLTSAIDPKWEDTMMEVARNEQQQGFAIRGMHDDSADNVTPNLAGAPTDGVGDEMASPRRGPRREFADKPE